MGFIAFLVYIVGFGMAWKQLSHGTGFVGSRLSPNTLAELNNGTSGAIIKKAVYSLLLGYVIWGALLLGIILKIVSLIFP